MDISYAYNKRDSMPVKVKEGQYNGVKLCKTTELVYNINMRRIRQKKSEIIIAMQVPSYQGP